MKVGVSLASLTSANLPIDTGLHVAREADALGFHSVWVPDYVAAPTGETPGGRPTSGYEPLMLVSALAACTQRVLIGTCTLTLPLRHPAITAKMLAAADLLSNGRVVLGAGSGDSREEFDALNLSGIFEKREAVTEEYLRAIKEMWLNTGPSNFSGEFVSFSDVGTFPKPRQRPHPAIMVAGESDDTMVLASRQATGYLAPFGPPGEVAARVSRLGEICRKDRRDPSEVEVFMLAPVSLSEAPLDANRQLLTGAIDQVWDDMRQFARAGVEHLIIVPGIPGETDPAASALGAMRRLAAEILPAFTAAAVA
jgi:probable F420-dependent oxidoreductase